MEIIKGTINELDEIVHIVEKYRDFYGITEQNPYDIRKFITDRINGEQSMIFLAMEQGKALGFIQLYPSYSTVSLRPQWILNDLYVTKENRSHGVAGRLMEAVKDYFEDKAKGFILVTEKTNAAAKKFYEKNGWETGEYDFYTYFYR